MNVISISNYFARNPLSFLNTIHTFPTENCPRSNQVSHLLSKSSLEEIWSLRQKEDAERSRATEGGLFSCAPHGNKNTEAMNFVLVGSNGLASRSWNLGDSWQTLKISFWVVVSATVSTHPKYSIKSIKSQIIPVPFSGEGYGRLFYICDIYIYKQNENPIRNRSKLPENH